MSPERIADHPAAVAMRRKYLIADLRNAINEMSVRYGYSCADHVVALSTGNPDRAGRHWRQKLRREKALARLTRALANLADA